MTIYHSLNDTLPTPELGLSAPGVAVLTPIHLSSSADNHSARALLDQVGHALALLDDTAAQLADAAAMYAAQRQLGRLQPDIRQAEQAMHQLRRYGWPRPFALTCLSQHLTVLVLVADMLAAGQLGGASFDECRDLLVRNTASALECLHDLYAQMADAVAPSPLAG